MSSFQKERKAVLLLLKNKQPQRSPFQGLGEAPTDFPLYKQPASFANDSTRFSTSAAVVVANFLMSKHRQTPQRARKMHAYA